MTVETELMLSNTSNYYYGIITKLLSRVPVYGFVVVAFSTLRTQVLHKVNDKENIFHLFDKEVRKQIQVCQFTAGVQNDDWVSDD
jgi:hypothetical protein